MAERELVIQLASGLPRFGLWCDTCLTPARYELDLYRMADDGPHPMGTAARCARCQGGDNG